MLPGDVSASKRYWARDIIEPPVETTPRGTIEIRDEPGFGYALDQDFIRQHHGAGGNRRLTTRRHGLLYVPDRPDGGVLVGNFIVAKIALREFPPVLLAGLRVGAGGAADAAGLLVGRTQSLRDRWTRWRRAAAGLASGCGASPSTSFSSSLGLSRTSVAHAAIIIGLTPMLGAALSPPSPVWSASRPRKAAGMADGAGGGGHPESV